MPRKNCSESSGSVRCASCEEASDALSEIGTWESIPKSIPRSASDGPLLKDLRRLIKAVTAMVRVGGLA